MSDDSQAKIEAINKGELPSIPPVSDSAVSGLEASQRGLDSLTFGLQKITEGLESNKDK